MTGTDEQAFSWLNGKARFWRVDDGRFERFWWRIPSKVPQRLLS